tara:strand:- start:486 stop:2810 length:2325 start_codon:yes stop_codon:yes gene_type:complete
MSHKLVIVESPAKCKKIEEYLGSGYKCIASYGHIQNLATEIGLKCIDIENNFKPTFSVLKEKEKHISKMRSEISKASEVILATDDDREGEGIAWHICQLFNLPVSTTKRMIFHEITKTALQNAVGNCGTLNMDLVNAQQARQVLDLLVGYIISPILWQKISRNSKTGLSAGRCQSPALRLVYDNQKDIDSSPGKKVYNTTGYFTDKNILFTLNFNHNDESSMENFLEESVNHDHIITCQKPKTVTKNPPSPFTTSGLQQTASSNYNISPKDTMKICQKLYEAGLITYMRTDSKTYSQEFIEKAKEHIKNNYGEEYIHKDVNKLSERTENKPKKKSKKKEKEKDKVEAQEAHEAIRPTKIDVIDAPDAFEPREKKIYKLIWKTTIESCMEAAKYNSITASITAPETHSYRNTEELVMFPGWKIVGGYDKENPIYNYLRSIKNDSITEYKKINSKVSMKELKSHYNEAKLIQILEEKGIGRPSTFASLLDKIMERGYVKKEDVKGKKINCIDFELTDDTIEEKKHEKEFGNEKNRLVIQPVGLLVIEFLIENFQQLFNYDYTKNMEDRLDFIAKGDMIWYNLCDECHNEIKSLTSKIPTIEKTSIKIDDQHTYIISKNGPVIKCTNGDQTTFKSVKSDINLDDLKKGTIGLADVISDVQHDDKSLGEYHGERLILKKGKFGYYLSWGNNKKSIPSTDFDESNFTIEDAISIIETKDSNIIRKIDDNSSVRNGKYGPYIFHKTSLMKKPKFIKLKAFKENYETCDLKILLDFVENNK